MAFTNYEAFLEAKKRMETVELRKLDNSLTVDEAYDILVADQVRSKGTRSFPPWTSGFCLMCPGL